MGLRDTILAARDLKMEPVAVPEWPDVGTVYVRAMSGRTKDAYEQWCLDCKNNHGGRVQNARGMLAALTVCDQDGVLVFTDADAESLGQKSAAPLDRILDVAMRLNGMTQAEVDALEKN
jgi:hypothetical protein